MNYSTKQIRLFAVFFSLLLSFFMFITDDIINRDGILYLNMAQAFLDGGLVSTAELYDWPFFSILIAYIHQLSSFSIEHSAFLLNGLLFALFIDTLVNISNKILPDTRQLIIASGLIICFGTLNEYRGFIIRDIGYWAFCSLTLYRFILFIEKPTLRNATLWQIVAVVSILFRIEGTMFLIGFPLYLFIINHPKHALKQNIQLSYLLVLGLIIASMASISSIGLSEAYGKLGTIGLYLNTETYLTTLNHSLELMETQILNKFSQSYSGLILISGLLAMLCYKLIKGISLIYWGLYIASLMQRHPQKSTPYSRLLLYFTLLNIAILIVFLLSRYFISTRYCIMALTGLFLLLLPRMCLMIESLWLKRSKTLLSIIGFILLIGLIDSVTSSRSKSYIKNTAIWASQNLPKNSTILTDNQFIEYYVKVHHHDAAISRNDISLHPKYDYLIVIEKRKQQALKETLAAMNIESIFTLSSKRGDKASVYKIIPTNSN